MNYITSKISVLSRIKPLSQNESMLNKKKLLKINNQEIILSIPNSQEEKYIFETLYTEIQTQEEIFNDIGLKMISNSLNGYNTSLLCYGGKDTGKTYTLLGPMYTMHEMKAELHGIIPRFLKFLLDTNKLKSSFKLGTISSKITFSCIEIDDEKIKDLLENKVIDDGCKYSEIKLENYDKGKLIINSYIKNRSEKIQMNNHSCLFIFNIITCYTKKNETEVYSYESQVIFGDLAKEDSSTIHSLEKLIHFSSQKITVETQSKSNSLLKSIIGGDSQLYFMFHITQNLADIQSTLKSLKFSLAVKNIENKIFQHKSYGQTLEIVMKDKEKLENEIKELKEKSHANEHNISNAAHNPVDGTTQPHQEDSVISDLILKKQLFEINYEKIIKKTELVQEPKDDNTSLYFYNRMLSEVKEMKKIQEMYVLLMRQIIDIKEKTNLPEIKDILTDNVQHSSEISSDFEINIENILNFHESILEKLEYERMNNYILSCQIKELKKENLIFPEESKEFLKEFKLLYPINDKGKQELDTDMLDKLVTIVFSTKNDAEKKYQELESKNSKILELEGNLKANEIKEIEWNDKIIQSNQEIEKLNQSLALYQDIYKSGDKLLNFVRELSLDEIIESVNKVNNNMNKLSQQYTEEISKLKNFKKLRDIKFSNILLKGKNSKKNSIMYNKIDKENQDLKEKVKNIDPLKQKENEEKIKKLEKELEEAIKERESLEKALETFKNEKSLVEEEKRSYLMKMKEMEAFNEKLIKEKENKISSIESEVLNLTNSKKETEKKLLEVEENRKYLTSKLENALLFKIKAQAEKEKTNKELKEANAKLTEINDQIEKIKNEKDKEISQKEKEIARLIGDRDEVSKMQKENEIKLIQITNSLNSAKRKTGQNEKEIEKLQKEKNNLECIAKTYIDKQEKLKEKISKLNSKCQDLKEEKKNIEEEKIRYINENLQLSEHMNEIFEELQIIRLEKREVEKDYDDVKQKLIELENTKNELQKNVEIQASKNKEKIDAIKEEKQKIDEEKDKAEKKCNSLNSKLTELSNQLEKLEKEKESLDINNEEKINSLSQQISEIKNIISSLQKELDDEMKRKEEFEKKSNLLSKENARLIQENQKLTKNLSELNNKTKEKEEKLTKQIKDYEMKANNLNQTIIKLQKQKDDADKAKAELEEKEHELNSKIDKLNDEKKKIVDEKTYLDSKITNLIQDTYLMKNNDILALLNKGIKYEEKFKEIFGKKYDFSNIDMIEINWNEAKLSKLSKKIILLREEKKELNQDLSTIRAFLKSSMKNSLISSQMKLLITIKEQNRTLLKELEIIKEKNKELENYILTSKDSKVVSTHISTSVSPKKIMQKNNKQHPKTTSVHKRNVSGFDEKRNYKTIDTEGTRRTFWKKK